MKYPPEVEPQDEAAAAVSAQTWALAHGLAMLKDGSDVSSAGHAPVSLYPTPFSRTAFEHALKVQPAFNELYYRVCMSSEWLVNVLDDIAKFDTDFTGRLLDLHLKAQRHGVSQHLTGGVFRSDYIVNNRDVLKQVEFNAVSVSFGALSTRVSELHNFLAGSGTYGVEYPKDSIPISPSLQKIAASLASMHNAYVKGLEATKQSMEGPAAILFVVQPGERNIFDQRLIEFELYSAHGIASHRVTLSDVKSSMLLENKRLYHDASGNEISVVYYRSGYGPSDYPTQTEWDARLYLECTHAIQCPSVLTQLSGAKKIQQLLSDRDVIAKVKGLSLTPTQVDDLVQTFVSIHPFDEESPEGRHARKLAFDQPQLFVLKPQREGGGNNVYRENIPGFLTSTPKSNWGAYILMELINPPNLRNKIIRDGKLHDGEIVSELGVFGACLWNTSSGECLLNDTCGWLLRSKLRGSDEGGVAAGFGFVDGVYLV